MLQIVAVFAGDKKTSTSDHCCIQLMLDGWAQNVGHKTRDSTVALSNKVSWNYSQRRERYFPPLMLCIALDEQDVDTIVKLHLFYARLLARLSLCLCMRTVFVIPCFRSIFSTACSIGRISWKSRLECSV